MSKGKAIRLADWRAGILKTDKGKPRKVPANATLIFSHDPAWQDVLAYDEFAETIVTTKPPPWRACDAPGKIEPGDWTDHDTTRAQNWLADFHGVDLGDGPTLAAIAVTAMKRRIHPVRDELDAFRWDGKRRAPTWLVDVMGADDTPLVRAIGQAWLVSCVARIYRPGCKVDTVLVLEGKPGIFKSSVLRALVGDRYFLEMSIADVANKDAMQLLRRKWIAEFPEIDGLSRTEQAHVKAFFSRQVDTYRPSYGKGTRDFPRQIAFAATTNKEQYIADETGGTGRRLWPVWCTRGDVALATKLREQLWAEAVARFQSGEQWHLTDPELRDAERESQDARFRADPWEQTIAAWLAKPQDMGPSKAERGVTTSDVLEALGLEVGRRDQAAASRVGSVLRRLGWVPPKHPETRNGVRVRPYRPVDGAGTNGHTLVPLERGPDATLEPLEGEGDGGWGEDAYPPR